MIFLRRNTPNNKDLDATNKNIKKVTWHRCWSISIMKLDQLIFTWKARFLVLVTEIYLFRDESCIFLHFQLFCIESFGFPN